MSSENLDKQNVLCEHKRWSPLGFSDTDNPKNSPERFNSKKLNELEEEHELLTTSLFALTTHFAQVQLRLRQIVNAPVKDKQHLLKSLEEFASCGVCELQTLDSLELVKNDDEVEQNETDGRTKTNKQLEIVEQLKEQLTDLELHISNRQTCRVSAEHIFKKHKTLLDELKSSFDKSGRSDWENVPGSMVNHYRMKEHIVNQLKTQITDLEHFVKFLQSGIRDLKSCTCPCPVHGDSTKSNAEMRTRTIGLMKRATSLIQMFVEMQFGCGDKHYKSGNVNSTMSVYRYGELRASLEQSVSMVEAIVRETGDRGGTTDYMSDSEGAPVVLCNTRLTTAVRKGLAPSLCRLLQHGLIANVDKTAVVPLLMCLPSGDFSSKEMHAWELVLLYYHLKNGERFNSTPARKLSQSFNLDIVGGSQLSPKQSLLSTIGAIIASHSLYKRSYDSQFKAFVCAALNANKLVIWLNLILQCKAIVQNHYTSWSYFADTAFKDALRSLDRLTKYKYDLPVDLAVRHFQNINDIFL